MLNKNNNIVYVFRLYTWKCSFVLINIVVLVRFQMTKMIHIQTLIPHPYSDGVIRHELREWKNVRKNRRNTRERKQSMNRDTYIE